MIDHDNLPSDLLEQLRRLDPVRGTARTDPTELRARADSLVEAPRIRRNHWAPLAVAACIALVATLAVALRPGSPSSAPRELGAGQQPIPSQYQAIARHYNPLSADMSISCLGADIPVAALAMPGTAQYGRSPSSQKLRDYLASRPSLQNDKWLLISASAKQLVFIARVGTFGMSWTVILPAHGQAERDNCAGQFAAGQLDAGPNQVAVPFQVTKVQGRTITVMWQTGECSPGGPPDLSFRRFAAKESDGSVHLLLITTPRAPDPVPSNLPSGTVLACAGVGLGVTSTFTLQQPLGTRHLYDDAAFPAPKRH